MKKEDLKKALRSQYGQKRPRTNRTFTVINEETVSIHIEWDDEIIAVELLLQPHDDYQNIIPIDGTNCKFYDDYQSNPSSITRLPDEYVDKFNTVVETLEEVYLVQQANSGEPVCEKCLSGEKLVFITILMPTN